jgi:hypothetical protein
MQTTQRDKLIFRMVAYSMNCVIKLSDNYESQQENILNLTTMYYYRMIKYYLKMCQKRSL